MDRKRIENAVKIIRHAINNNISVKTASIECGFGDTYVKNVKRLVIENFDKDGSKYAGDYNVFMGNYEQYIKNGKKNNQSTKQEPSTSGNRDELVKNETTKFKASGKDAEFSWKGNKDHFNKKTSNDGSGQNSKSHRGYPEGHIKTLDQLLEKCDVDLNEWDVRNYEVNKWDVTSWKPGYAQTWENFQVKAKLERKEDVFQAKTMEDIFKSMVENYEPPIMGVDTLQAIRCSKNENTVQFENNLLEVNIFDLHLGKLGWSGEVGENFDTKIASKRFMHALEKMLQQASGFNFSRVLFPIGNDFFNSDNKENTTSYGTSQDEDLRWQKTLDVGCNLVVDGINLLRQAGVPVDVVVVAGNHDFERSYHLGMYLKAWFRNDELVNIDNGASPRKYYNFGELLLGLTHGKDEKEASLPLLMASEARELWGKTTFHEWHLGHIHRKRTNTYTILEKNRTLSEDLGVTVRYMSSLTGPEEWHHRKGFTGSIKAADGFIWNDKTGLQAHLNVNII